MKEIAQAADGWKDEFAKDLGLSDDQKQKIQDVLGKAKADNEKERSAAKAAFEAFKKDQFSMEDVAPESDVGARARARAEGMIATAKQITDILTPDQRTKLADKLEAKTGDTAHGSAADVIQQGIVAGYRAGAVGGWGGGYARGGVAVAGGVGGVVGGYGPGIW